MTLVYQSAAFGANPEAPGAHALVIGVGQYPHLLGGDADIIDDPMGLRQLESPPVSAKAFANWLIPKADPQLAQFSNPDAPLATVDLVLSPAASYTSPAGDTTLVELATRKHIQRAFDHWLTRLQKAPGSVAIFYFCGHGIMTDNDILLASDFGSDRNNPWLKAFDVSTTVRALKRLVRCPLFFFVDACRQISRSVAETLGATALPLCTARASQGVLTTSALIYAAAEGTKAYARAGPTVSRFTTALILALSGHVGRQFSNSPRWVVTGSVLANGIADLLQRESGPGVPEQFPEQEIRQGSEILHVLDAPPQVLVTLKVSPDQMLTHSVFSLCHNKHGDQPCTLNRGAWEAEVIQGEWNVRVASPTRLFPDKWLRGELLVAPCYAREVPVL